jgi:membrane protease YdiL (CAAX protease family)
MYTEASPIPPLTPPVLNERRDGTQPPGLWAALGLIVFYFALQVVSGTLIVLLIQLSEGFMHAPQGAAHPGNVLRTLPAMPAVAAMFTLMVSATLTLLLAHRKWPRLWSLALPPGFGFVLPVRPLFFALAVAVGLVAPVLGGLLTQLLAHGHKVSQDIQQLGGNASPALRIPLMLVVTSLGPLVEELLFRGVLLCALMQRWRVGQAVAISSLAFALVHLPGLQWQWYALPDLLLLALALGWLRLRSGSIWPSVLAHGVNNLLAVAAWFVAINLPG